MVSVVIPVYNVEKYLTDCIESVLEQDYQDIEIILVDDGSTDRSGKICDTYLCNERVRVIHKENQGLGMARNSGIEIAKGEYVTFLDSDDYWGNASVLSNLMQEIIENEADTCIGGYSRVDNEGNVIFSQVNIKEKFANEEILNSFFPRLLGSSPEKKDSFRPSVWNSIYSLEIIKKNKIQFPSERKLIAEDIVFDIDYYQYAKKVIITDNTGYYYRVTPGSLTQKYKSDRFEKVVELYRYIFTTLEKKELSKECNMRAQRQFFVYLKRCISEENTKISKLSFKQSIRNIKNICNDEFTRKCVINYPINNLGIFQRVFVCLVKKKRAVTLYFLLNILRKSATKA